MRTTVIQQAVLQALAGVRTPRPNNHQRQRNLEEKKEAAAEAVRTRIIKQAILQALKESLTLQLNNQLMKRNLEEKEAAAAEANNQQMQRNLSHNVNSRIRMF